MAELKKRKKPAKKTLAEEVVETVKEEHESERFLYTPSDSDIFISSGSTLLDLAISGGRVRGGGIPGRLMAEIYGPPATGKTALAMEIAASCQACGGQADVADPEARLDFEYAKTYGTELSSDNYFQPNCVLDIKHKTTGKVLEEGLESIIKHRWKPERTDVINVLVADSIAALSTAQEMDKGDKRGQVKAKELHALCRTTARLIAKDNRAVIFTNQLTASEWGEDSPGGVAIKFYASLRIQLKQKMKLEATKKNAAGKDIKKVYGILSDAIVQKSSVDDPYRTAPIYLIFGFGVDDLRANLQYNKDMNKDTKYDCCDGKMYVAMNDAIKYVEEHDLESEVREFTIDLWEEAQELFTVERKTKKRF